MKFIVPYFILLLPIFSIAQLEGYIYDEQGNPVEFATIFLQSYQLGTMADELGYFSLPIPETYLPDTIRVKHIAFAEKIVYIEKIAEQIIQLESRELEICSVDVFAYKAPSLLAKSIESIATNYPSETHYTNGTYIQIHKEDGKYARYIEAFVSVENTGYKRRKINEQKHLFSIITMRRSGNYERNGDQHGDHLYDLMSENPLQNIVQSILNEKNIPLYTIQFDYEYDSLGFSKLIFQNKTWNLSKNYSGEIIINTADFAIVSLVLQSFPNTQTTHDNKSDWKFQNGVYTIDFEKIEDVYQLKSCSKWYNHHIVNTQGNTSYIVEEFFDWKTAHHRQPNGLKYSKLSNLYTRDYTYDKAYWNDNLIPEEISHDLSKNKSLEDQFYDR